MARIICPFCIKYHDFSVPPYKCATYENLEVPDDYIREYTTVRPLWLVTLGFTQHGKSTYLTALTLMLEQAAKAWDGMYYAPLDSYTFDTIRAMRRETLHGELPVTTPKKVTRPLLFSIYNMPFGRSRCLVMYDVGGEVFESLDEMHEFVTAIRQVNTTWFLVSLHDLEENKDGKMLPDLFQIYRTGMQKLRVDLRDRNLIVIYTKADLVDFSSEIRDYLRTDPFRALTVSGTDSEELDDSTPDD